MHILVCSPCHIQHATPTAILYLLLLQQVLYLLSLSLDFMICTPAQSTVQHQIHQIGNMCTYATSRSGYPGLSSIILIETFSTKISGSVCQHNILIDISEPGCLALRQFKPQASGCCAQLGVLSSRRHLLEAPPPPPPHRPLPSRKAHVHHAVKPLHCSWSQHDARLSCATTQSTWPDFCVRDCKHEA